MKNVQSKINKLIMALQMNKRIIKINQKQFYSSKFQKTFTEFEVIETTEEEITARKRLKEIKEKFDISVFEEKARLHMEREELKVLLKKIKIDKYYFKNKKDLLLYLVERFKEVTSNETKS